MPENISDAVLSRLPELLESLDLTDPERKQLQQLGKKALMQRVVEAQEETMRQLKLARGRALTSREYERRQENRQSSCPHYKLTPTGPKTMLSGQQIRGRNLILFCQSCLAKFSIPPQTGMPAPSPRLIPPQDHIGGDRRVLSQDHITEILNAAKNTQNEFDPEAAGFEFNSLSEEND